MSSVQIESILRVAVGIADDGGGGFEWWGSGATGVTRTGLGVFVIAFTDAVDVTQSVCAATPLGIGGQGGSFFTSETLTANDCTVRVWDDSQSAADPDGIHFTLTSSNVEMDWVPTI